MSEKREKPEERMNLELLKKFMSPEFMTADRREYAIKLKDRLIKDPALLAAFEEQLFGPKGFGVSQVAPTVEELKSFGWTEQDGVVACPAAFAAAAATYAAAAAQIHKQL